MRDPIALGLPLRSRPDLSPVDLGLTEDIGAVVLRHAHSGALEAGHPFAAVLHFATSIYTPVFGIAGRPIIRAFTIRPSGLLGSSQALLARSASLLACWIRRRLASGRASSSARIFIVSAGTSLLGKRNLVTGRPNAVSVLPMKRAMLSKANSCAVMLSPTASAPIFQPRID